MIDATSVQQWFEIAKYIGAGATFVLAPILWVIWSSLREEIAYSKTRDRETLTVLSTLTTVLEKAAREDEHREDKLLVAMKATMDAIHELKQIMLAH